METLETKKVVEDINTFIRSQLWLDFEVLQYDKQKLTIIGSIDISNMHDIEIVFEDIFFVSLPIEWKTDTSRQVLSILEGEKAIILNKKFQVEQGYSIFAFAPEDYPDDFGCYVCAKKITFNLTSEK
ncbi:hypothetical protein [Paenibacillus cookii]|uniref:Uncharacterized protein n=1 Tax=Paenibacillus cookii TaxID=157839 RepID=A0ABQ4LWI6_9BACL|nr:hypothetical protein [Paenibacillus cookii]GIO67640.1 hypothetical protein J21TS3_24610 [Paenibacillus cookii]